MTTHSSNPARVELTPGGLINLGESVHISAGTGGELVVRRGEAGAFAEVVRTRLAAAGDWRWTPPDCGMFLVEFAPDGAGETLRRPLAVVTREWAVCQITVGSFTSEDFADTIHGAGVAADYYITGFPARRAADFSCSDPRWPAYERLHGDAIHPHVMADAFGDIDAALDCDDPNWDSLSPGEIDARLRGLQSWWLRAGFAPLDRIASYTPSNPFVEACGRMGIGVLHSLVPEQNWSDGDWSINHWGMPTAPFWIATDDYRKCGARDDRAATGGAPVLGFTMNHYHVLSPHLTHWGDFVLSPSHFTRWIRAADAGDESLRFRQFLTDTVRGGTALGDAPFFFVAGFEFGRTFGTADMTGWNRAGLRRLFELARTEKLVFATSRDVYAYHRRHVPALAERVFRQRDSWMGVTVNGKPGQCGDAVIIERAGYKAAMRENAALPWMYYDYRETWRFATNDIHAPNDRAVDCAAELDARFSPSGDAVEISAARPLTRAIPVAFWDAKLADNENLFAKLSLAPLDDGREVAVIEIPAGWQGRASIALRPQAARSARRDEGRWHLQAFGSQGGNGFPRHVYLHLDAALMSDTPVTVTLKKNARVEGAGAASDSFPRDVPAGPVTLDFGPLKPWYRFMDCEPADIIPPADEETARMIAPAVLPPQGECEKQIAAANAALGGRARAHPALAGRKLLYEMYCGAALPHGTRSRAEAHDMPVIHPGGDGVSAKEFADGVMAFAPGRAVWYHPRGLTFRIYGLDALAKANPSRKWTILLHSFSPLGDEMRYQVSIETERRSCGQWIVPSYDAGGAFFAIQTTPADLDARGRLTIKLQTDQKQILYWWREKGFVAALHALWVAEAVE
ncbi:hypothetical protein [Ereboglobus luteus]|uniref:Uncharacterized protein n=1 Tax=Ereboglobus luteus TaxID=1796921 RepID=A0A2U8DZY4_9BACT|nr:hypothetical protein [Ereboglobus luteus]AWI08150.1 hypothetical protein CKA38_01720 [Ereboglobus luteus]